MTDLVDVHLSIYLTKKMVFMQIYAILSYHYYIILLYYKLINLHVVLVVFAGFSEYACWILNENI